MKENVMNTNWNIKVQFHGSEGKYRRLRATADLPLESNLAPMSQAAGIVKAGVYLVRNVMLPGNRTRVIYPVEQSY
jgi:hypothetical protein